MSTETVSSEDNLSGNSNETSDNTVRELELNVDIIPTKRIDSTESANSNATIEETILLFAVDTNANQIDQSGETPEITLRVDECKAPPNSFETSDTVDESDTALHPEFIEYVITYEDDECEALQRRGSCLSRGGSSTKSSMKKKKVNLNDSAEIIPTIVTHQQSVEDDDEVFSDSIPPKLPRGDMCTPFVTKRGSIPGLAALPDWFREEK